MTTSETPLRSKVISLNAGGPEAAEWNGQNVVSSMRKRQLTGALSVRMEGVVGDVFANKKYHGLPHSAVYVWGLSSIRDFLSRLEINSYQPGSLGENLTVEHFDEGEVSVGDIFEIGSVKIQATFPRIPCGKVNVFLRHADGQKQMLACGRSGVYCRVLKAGEIPPGSEIARIEKASVRVSIKEVYEHVACGKSWDNPERLKEILKNPALPDRLISDLQKRLAQ